METNTVTLPQAVEYKYFGVLFSIDCRMEQKTDKGIGG